MSVWYCLPSKRHPEEAESVLKLWRERGYKIALWCDVGNCEVPAPSGNIVITSSGYPGYAKAVNSLVKDVLNDSGAEWFVCGGDDIEPDPNHSAEEISQECSRYFSMPPEADRAMPNWTKTFGVMQPTGDRWGVDPKTHTFVPLTPNCEECYCRVCGRGKIAPIHLTGAYIDRVAGSPWIGREFARRVYGGKGPYWPEYTHMGVDEELQAVAQKLGVFWQRPDLTHYHRHWGRGPGDRPVDVAVMPKFLEHANSPEEWRRYKKIFAARQAAGFPGHEPI